MKKTASLLKMKPTQYDGLWLSVSKAKTFDDCKAKFRYCYIQQLPRKTWSFHVLGTFAHSVLERFDRARLDGETMPDNNLMTKCFNEALKENKKGLLSEDKMLVYSMAQEFLEIKAQQRADGVEPRVIDVESNFYIDIAGEVLLNGKIDIEQMDVDEVLHLADYKTSKSVRYVKNDFFQLLTYAYVKCIENPELEKVRCSYIMLRHSFKHITKEFSRDEIMQVQSKLLDYAEQIKQEKLFRPNPTRLCEYCDYLDRCQDGKEFIYGDCVSNYGEGSWG